MPSDDGVCPVFLHQDSAPKVCDRRIGRGVPVQPDPGEYGGGFSGALVCGVGCDGYCQACAGAIITVEGERVRCLVVRRDGLLGVCLVFSGAASLCLMGKFSFEQVAEGRAFGQPVAGYGYGVEVLCAVLSGNVARAHDIRCLCVVRDRCGV